MKWVLFENHIVGEVLGFSNIQFLTLDTEVSVFGGELENFISLLGDFGGGEGNKGADGRSGRDKGEELGVEKFDGIGFTGEERVDNFFGDGKSLLGVGVLSTLIGGSDGVFTTFEVSNSLLSDEDKVTFNTLSSELLESGLSLLDHERVVTSAKTTVTGNGNKGDLVYLTLGQQRKVGGLSSKTVDKSSENRLKSLREGTGGKDSILGTTHLSGGNKLHGRGNLFGVVDGRDTVTDSCWDGFKISISCAENLNNQSRRQLSGSVTRRNRLIKLSWSPVIIYGNSNQLLTIGLSVHNNGASSGSVSISLVGKHIADSTNLGNTGSERRRAGGESTSGGNSCGGDEKELHGH